MKKVENDDVVRMEDEKSENAEVVRMESEESREWH